jgi:hypothetical protein
MIIYSHGFANGYGSNDTGFGHYITRGVDINPCGIGFGQGHASGAGGADGTGGSWVCITNGCITDGGYGNLITWNKDAIWL